MIKISLLVSNFGRTALFRRTLDTVIPQLIEGDEIVVVDDGVYDGMKELLESTGIAYQYVNTGNAGKYRSGVFAKNIGLKMARNELIVINDPEVNHVSRCIDQLREHFKDRPRKFINAAMMYFCQNQFYPDKITSKMENSMAPFIAGVMKKDLMAIGGWDERFKYWGNDDNQLMYRLGLNGCKHFADVEMVGLHLWHERPPAEAMGDCNNSLMEEKNIEIVANQGREWGII